MLMEHMTTAEVEAELAECQTVILPFGVMEAHGAHLPLSTDTLQAYDAAKRAAELVNVFVAPPVPYGMCRSAAGHPGTIGIGGNALRALTTDVVRSLYNTGFRNVICYSGHHSSMQLAAMTEAGEALLRDCPELNFAVVSEFDLIRKHAQGVYENADDLHAGEVETSRMLFVRPELVRTNLLPEATYRTTPGPMLVRDVRRYWEGSTDGAPSLATREKGEQFARIVAEQLAELVRRLADFQPH